MRYLAGPTSTPAQFQRVREVLSQLEIDERVGDTVTPSSALEQARSSTNNGVLAPQSLKSSSKVKVQNLCESYILKVKAIAYRVLFMAGREHRILRKGATGGPLRH